MTLISWTDEKHWSVFSLRSKKERHLRDQFARTVSNVSVSDDDDDHLLLYTMLRTTTRAIPLNPISARTSQRYLKRRDTMFPRNRGASRAPPAPSWASEPSVDRLIEARLFAGRNDRRPVTYSLHRAEHTVNRAHNFHRHRRIIVVPRNLAELSLLTR